jgi:hypothetical protein
MKIYLIDQKNKFKKHLDFLKSKMVMKYDKNLLEEKTSSIDINSKKKIEELNVDFLFDYQIFPDNIMSFKTQWSDEKRKMEIGDTIAQQVFLPPSKNFSQKIVFGVRINEIINQTDKKGFSYETLEGHVEKGVSTFTIEQIGDRLVFKIQTFSAAGNILTKLLAPIFSLPYQNYCTKMALKNVKRQLEAQNIEKEF